MIDITYCFKFEDILLYAILIGSASFACGAFGAIAILRVIKGEL